MEITEMYYLDVLVSAIKQEPENGNILKQNKNKTYLCNIQA